MQVNYRDLRLPEHRSASPFNVGSLDAVGVDLKAYIPGKTITVNPGQRVCAPCGFAIEIPKGYYGRVAPRSGLAVKNGIDILAGVVDPDYRGEIKVILINHDDSPFIIHDGDRIAQMVMEMCEAWTPNEVDVLSDTVRGVQGWGSTGVAS